MLKSKLKKSLLFSCIGVTLMSTVAFAGTINYSGFSGKYNFYFSGGQAVGRNDRSSGANSDFKVTSFVQCESCGAQSFDTGYNWAQSSVNIHGSKFTGKFGICGANSGNMYKYSTLYLKN